MSTGIFKLDPNAQKKWRETLQELAQLSNKDHPEGVQKLAMQSGRRFVKNVASVTPPASGSLDGGAKKAGEAAVLEDLLKLALPAQQIGGRAAREAFASAQDLIEAHAQARVAGGRVNPRNRRKLLLSVGDFNRVVKQIQGMVGWLAAGLNASAKRLGVALPAWIKRHGEKFGEIDVQMSANGIRIRMVQNVPYVDAVKGYNRKWNFALHKEVATLAAMIKVVWRKRVEKAKGKMR